MAVVVEKVMQNNAVRGYAVWGSVVMTSWGLGWALMGLAIQHGVG